MAEKKNKIYKKLIWKNDFLGGHYLIFSYHHIE